jgi:hypothetical protein
MILYMISDIDVLQMGLNGTFCEAKLSNKTRVDLDDFKISEYQICNFIDVDLGSCYSSEGSHAKTFWTYFFLRMIFQVIFCLILILSPNDIIY